MNYFTPFGLAVAMATCFIFCPFVEASNAVVSDDVAICLFHIFGRNATADFKGNSMERSLYFWTWSKAITQYAKDKNLIPGETVNMAYTLFFNEALENTEQPKLNEKFPLTACYLVNVDNNSPEVIQKLQNLKTTQNFELYVPKENEVDYQQGKGPLQIVVKCGPNPENVIEGQDSLAKYSSYESWLREQDNGFAYKLGLVPTKEDISDVESRFEEYVFRSFDPY